MGAGLSGAIMAYEMKGQMRREDRLTVVTKDPIYHFVPSNPWVPVGWRKREALEVDLAPTFAKRGIAFKASPVTKVSPKDNTIETADGASIKYDYLIIATGPELAFDEVEGLGPEGFTQSICHIDHAEKAAAQVRSVLQESRPDRHRRGAGRLVLRPGLRVHVHRRDGAASSQDPRPGADDLRDGGALHRPPRPRRRRRHQGAARERVARTPHQVDDQRADQESRRRQDDRRRGRRRRRRQGDQGAAVRLLDDPAGVPRHRAAPGHRGPRQSARLRHRRQAPAEPGLPQHLLGRRLRGDPADRPDAGALRRAEDRLHDRIRW